jgi:hypothetical protein
MSDLALRRAEREHDVVNVLAARIRCAEISPDRVAYAAALGHPAALLIAEPAELPAEPRERSARGARLLGHVETVRWACDLAERAVDHAWTTFDPRPADAIAAARRWADCPCEEHRQDAEAAWTSAEAALPVWPERMAVEVVLATMAAAEAAEAGVPTWAAWAAAEAAENAVLSGAMTRPEVFHDLAERLLK